MSTPEGFDRAPVTRGILAVTTVLSFASQFIPSEYKPYLYLNLQTFTEGQIWRLLTSQLLWLTPSQLIIGTILLYNFRLFERNFGSNKYAGGLLFFFLCNLIIQIILMVSISGLEGSPSPLFAAGPYSIIFGLFPSFYRDIPALSHVRVFSIMLSDKSPLYLLGLQLLCSALPNYNSFISAGIGLLTGLLWITPCFGLDRIRVPSFCSNGFIKLHSFIGSLFTSNNSRPSRFGHNGNGYVLGGSGPGSDYQQVLADDGLGMSVLNGNSLDDTATLISNENYSTPLMFPANPGPSGIQAEPDISLVRSLTAMGFEESAARSALIQTNNNIDAATSRLLG